MAVFTRGFYCLKAVAIAKMYSKYVEFDTCFLIPMVFVVTIVACFRFLKIYIF